MHNTDRRVYRRGLATADGRPAIAFTINYQNGPQYDLDVEYSDNTTGNPPGIDGDIVNGPAGAGNLEAITYQGVRINYNAPPVRFLLPSGRPVYVQPNSYQGRQYATFLPNLIGGGVPCTTQIAGLDPAVDFSDADGNPAPITFTIHYQNGPAFDQTVAYSDNTAPNPPGIEGEVVDGPRDGGNIESITFQGVTIEYNDEPVDFTLPSGTVVSVQPNSYNGHQYATVLAVAFR